MMDWLYVGKIVNTHGLRGEVKVISATDFSEERFARGATLYVRNEKTDSYRPFTVKSYRRNKQFDYLTFENYDSINEIEPFKGCSLYVRKDQLSELSNGDFYYYQIIGAEVVTDTGVSLGTIKEILSPGANDVWVVKTKGKDILLPCITDVIKSVDTDQKRITVHLIPGLVDDAD
ncbi:ribosome maturation factor RimM [Sporolactobacillus sp. THM7-4]|nr:ribosome maturation factor RimM [Sporolactobacillus sp. THM7-4]